MPNYNEAQGVADLLSKFDFNIISEGPGDFSTQHRKYTCEFSKPGIESFTTTYQSNPRFGGHPTATDVFAALASDALAVDGRHIDDFADEMGFEKPSQAIRAYESCRKTLDWLKNDMQLMTSEIADSATDIYTYDLLKWLPDNYEWLEEADFQGLLEGCKGDLIKMTQMAQYVCFTQDMYTHQEDIAKYAALEGLAAEGVYALADEVYDDVFDGITIDFNDNNMDIEDFASEAQNAIYDAMDEPLYDALGSNDEILEDGELSGDFEAIKESGYDFPNPCAMSAEAVRTVNEKGYETAFNEFWKEFMPDKGYEVPTVSEAAQESREASGKLEQDSHDGQTPEREDERADGDAEH